MEAGYHERYDLYYDEQTGEFTEAICSCDPSECDYKKRYVEDGMPSHMPNY